jgi:aryl-alcohol dehydrogenase-like predicted oxidoreductase
MIRVAAGAGSIDVGFFKFRSEVKARKQHFIKVLQTKIIDLDTSNSYFYGCAERTLGLAIKESKIDRELFQIDTKIGNKGNSAPIPLNYLIGTNRLVQKFQIKTGRIIDDFDMTIDPSMLIKSLTTSLEKLNLTFVDTYFMHGFCGWQNYQRFIDNFERVRSAGLTRSIGITLDQKIDIPLSWCDKIQIPLSLLNEFPEYQGQIIVNQIFSGNNGDFNEVIRKIKSEPRVTKVILGTRKIENITRFYNALNSL